MQYDHINRKESKGNEKQTFVAQSPKEKQQDYSNATSGMPPFLQRSTSQVVQRQPLEEEEETMQMKADVSSPLQRQPLEEEEEELQSKHESTVVQRQPLEEEDEAMQINPASASLQGNVTVSQPNDPYEKEADRVADQVMSMPDSAVQRQPVEEEEEELQPKTVNRSIQRQAEDEEEEEEETPVQTKSIASGITPFQKQVTQRQSLEADEEQLQEKPAQGSALQAVYRQAEEEEEELQPKSNGRKSGAAPSHVARHVKTLNNGGQPLPSSTRSFFESRFGQDFSRVRVHTDAKTAQSARDIQAKAYTSGSNIAFASGQYSPYTHEGKRLLAHELTHVIQQTGKVTRKATPRIQRRVMMYIPPAGSRSWAIWHEMPRRERRRLVRRRFTNQAQRNLAYRVIEDLALASDRFRFTNEAELYSEVRKRVLTSRIMQATQRTVSGRRGFGYPFTTPSLFWGPRVNYAARNYWTPGTPDNYSLRRDPVKRRQIRRLPRNRRHTVYGDQSGLYQFQLNSAGRTNPYQAIVKLFDRQPVHKRSLIHCDYLISLVHFRAFMETLGQSEFNRRARAFMRGGRRNIVLRYNLFSDLEVPFGARTSSRPLGSLQYVRPSSEADLVIGDHVVFFNHKAYDLINRNIGNAWRLENALLIDRPNRRNIFLGHGSGRKTAAQMRAKLAQEYNDVVNIAFGVIHRTRRGSAASRTSAMAEMRRRFPNVRRVGGRWRIQGRLSLFGLRRGGTGPYYSAQLRRIRANEVLGLKDPLNPHLMNPVRRPVESR